MDSKDAMDMAMMRSVTVFKRQWVDGRPDGGSINNEEAVSAAVGTQIVRLQKLIGFAGRSKNLIRRLICIQPRGELRTEIQEKEEKKKVQQGT